MVVTGLRACQGAPSTSRSSQHVTGFPVRHRAPSTSQGSQHVTGLPVRHRAPSTSQGYKHVRGLQIGHSASRVQVTSLRLLQACQSTPSLSRTPDVSQDSEVCQKSRSMSETSKHVRNLQACDWPSTCAGPAKHNSR